MLNNENDPGCCVRRLTSNQRLDIFYSSDENLNFNTDPKPILVSTKLTLSV